MEPSTTSIGDWGTRLSEAVRAAIAAGNLDAARDLALRGDGQARDLAREYAFMAHGLGITLRILLDLLPGVPASQAGGGAGEPAARVAQDLSALLRRLLAGLPRGAPGDPQAPHDPDTLIGACHRALAATPAALAAEQARLADEVVAALAEGRAQAAVALLDAKDRAWLAVHDPMVRFMADGFAWALTHFGAQALLDMHVATAQAQRAGFEKWERMPAAEFAALTAFLLRQHMGEVTVDEDERRFTIRQSPCGSGGRLRLQRAYDGPDALPFVDGPGPLTFGEPRMPVYCTHCAIWNGGATLAWFGRAHWVFESPARADGGCTLHIFKRREDAPADYLRRVALPASDRAASGSSEDRARQAGAPTPTHAGSGS